MSVLDNKHLLLSLLTETSSANILARQNETSIVCSQLTLPSLSCSVPWWSHWAIDRNEEVDRESADSFLRSQINSWLMGNKCRFPMGLGGHGWNLLKNGVNWGGKLENTPPQPPSRGASTGILAAASCCHVGTQTGPGRQDFWLLKRGWTFGSVRELSGFLVVSNILTTECLCVWSIVDWRRP